MWNEYRKEYKGRGEVEMTAKGHGIRKKIYYELNLNYGPSTAKVGGG